MENIAKDSINQAIIFDNELDEKISNLSNMPFKFRQSFFHYNHNIRDLIYKGYVITYLIDQDKSIIVILNIFKNKNN